MVLVVGVEAHIIMTSAFHFPPEYRCPLANFITPLKTKSYGASIIKDHIGRASQCNMYPLILTLKYESKSQKKFLLMELLVP